MIKTKKWVSLLILGFGLILLIEGFFPNQIQKGLEKIPKTNMPTNNSVAPGGESSAQQIPYK